MKFSDRILLEQEYEEWVKDESRKIGAEIDGSRMMTMLSFLESRRMLMTYDPDKKAKLVNYLMNSGAVTVDHAVERCDSLAALPAFWCSYGAMVTVDYNKLADAAAKWLVEVK